MTVMSAFTKIKGGCFLHVNMAEATAATHCCQDAPATDTRRLNGVSLGIYEKNHVQELPAVAPDVACDMLPRGLEGKPTLRNYPWHMEHIKLPFLLTNLLVINVLDWLHNSVELDIQVCVFPKKNLYACLLYQDQSKGVCHPVDDKTTHPSYSSEEFLLRV
jgi:hypothetical protein